MIIEMADRVVLGGSARLLLDDRECAWAERHVRVDSDIAWLVGNYVSSDPAGNSNGHIFPLEDLAANYNTVTYKPLNLLHQGRYVVGSFVGAELVTPGAPQAAEGHPVVETLAGMWKNLFHDEFELVRRAHAEGTAFQSMECVPEEIACVAEGCGAVSKYVGRASDTYCTHLADGKGYKKLLKPHFGAGALIIPPVQPGWKQANINQVSSRQDRELVEQVYASMEAELPHLGPAEWESLMSVVIEEARVFPPEQRKKLAKSGAALPDGSFPVPDVDALRRAIKLAGNAKDPAAARRHIIKRARALGHPEMVPKGWA